MSESTPVMGPVFEKFLGAGHQLFNAMRLAKTESEHCAAYYAFMRPVEGAVVVDLGSGVGGLGDLLQRLDPSLSVVNVVNDVALARYTRAKGRVCILASFEDTGLPDECADVAMFNESMGHGHLAEALREAARLLKPAGVMVVKDFSPVVPGITGVPFSEWGYVCYREDLVIHHAAANGLLLDCVVHPPEFRDHWDALMVDDAETTAVVGGDQSSLPVRQVLYRFTKAARYDTH